MKNFPRLASHFNQYRALSTSQHTCQTPVESVQNERLQCTPAMAEGSAPKAKIWRRGKFDFLLGHSVGDGEMPFRRGKIRSDLSRWIPESGDKACSVKKSAKLLRLLY
jgi:hypothetical protein